VRTRLVLAAAAGVAAAATAHALDASGRLPFVHETADVREAMAPMLTASWLLLAGSLAAVAAATRVVLVGVPAAVVVSAFPERWGRHDIGAVAEPGALLGAALQILLLLVVVSAALVFADRLVASMRRRAFQAPRQAVTRCCSRVVEALLTESARSRAPPYIVA
jgi:hypothetical protein